MSYRIISDSSSDILSLENADYTAVPLKIITDNKEYIDDLSLDVDEMIKDLSHYKGTSKSSCPNAGDWLSSFGNGDGIFCITITSNLSGSYNSANIAAGDFLDENPEKKVCVLDSLSTGPENALIIEKLTELFKEDLSFEEIEKRVRQYMKSTHLIFCLESLRNLANNGRVSHAAAKVAGILGIRVVGKASNEGTLELTDKVRGSEKGISQIFKNMKASGYIGAKARIHHCNNPKGADALCSLIKSEFPDAPVTVWKTGALCSFYAEAGGLLVGFEGSEK